ncbi:hypothetical protein HHL22_10245 [Hymenobacter sp. RP-2-7]|uniref:Uncharacterized protein n=1 Tax=Hymenobacter polaris TaxID=2682546 RepID=A0A7Y0AEG6_9BACT|nr:hypothetical protein [Hymenobacter polaris]NML65585.1 hypothetical protein [Hymenobacter polaris]
MRFTYRCLVFWGSLLASQLASAQAAPSATSIENLPLTYCTALPRADVAHWDDDYARYAHFLTPEIRRTQLGLASVREGVHYWFCRPAATAHAQLDTLTRVADPQLLQGRWRSVLMRTIAHTDSAALLDKRIYRSVQLLPHPEADTGQNELLTADGHVTQFMAPAGAALKKEGRRKYELVSGRYLLLYGLSKAGGGVCQVGLDGQGRLILHTYGVTERKIPGQYVTYRTVLSQVIYERLPQ